MTEQITLEDLFQLSLDTIRGSGVPAAMPHLTRLADTCGTTVAEELPRFIAAAEGGETVREELLDELQTMGALMQFTPAPLPEYNFSVPETAPASDALTLPETAHPSDLRLFLR